MENHNELNVQHEPGKQVFGIHVPFNSTNETDALTAEIPSLAELGINLLIAEVNYSYAYTCHPELRMANPIPREHIRRLVDACRKSGIRLVPQFQCLGHQSWPQFTLPLLARYPEFDETPGMYPNNIGIYCRSWCPQIPQVNEIVFALMDELLEVFEADALHVGMDEVFLIASEFCPRCKGDNPARMFALAVNHYYDHLVRDRKVEMMMWGDRLLDDAVMGYGEWESSQNHTFPAIESIPRDIIICDWHYQLRAEYPSVPFFQSKGFRVLPGGFHIEEAVSALIDYAKMNQQGRLLGYLATTWGTAKPGEMSFWPPVTTAAKKLSVNI
jgi:hypothetical protein